MSPRAMRRRLPAAVVLSVMALAPLPVSASAAPDVNALWNEPDSIPADSAFSVMQAWWNNLNQQIPDDPTQRGLQELSQANTDLLSADALLETQRDHPGPQPVALIDPLLSTIYNAATGSNIKAPIGSAGDSVNQWLLNLEGRGTRVDIARGLLQDYRIKQAVAMRDLSQNPSADLTALLAANSERESSWLSRIGAASTPAEGVSDLLKKATQSTTAMAGHGQATTGDHGKGDGHARQTGPGQQATQPDKAPKKK